MTYGLLVGAGDGGRGALVFAEQLRQLSDIRRDPSRLVLRKQLGRRARNLTHPQTRTAQLKQYSPRSGAPHRVAGCAPKKQSIKMKAGGRDLSALSTMQRFFVAGAVLP